MTYTNNHKNYEQSYQGSNIGLLDNAYRKMPNLSIYRKDINGNPTDTYYNVREDAQISSEQKELLNPVAVAHLAKNLQKNMRIIPTLRIQYDFIQPSDYQRLHYNGYITFDIENNKYNKFLPKEIVPKSWLNSDINRADDQEEEGLTVMTDQNITWQPNLGKDIRQFSIPAIPNLWFCLRVYQQCRCRSQPIIYC